MNTEKDIAQLMDYLYGEMNTSEKAIFEKKLAENPALQAELDNLKSTKQLLGKSKEEVPTQPLVINPVLQVYKSKDQYWRRWAGVAASLLLILLTAAWWNLSISVGDGSITISFNKSQQSKLLKEKVAVEENLNAQRLELNEYLKNRVAALRDSLDKQFLMRKTQLSEVSSSQIADHNNRDFITKEELSVVLNSINQEQSENIAILINASAENQKQYSQSLVTELATYMEAKRESDLELINYALNEMQMRSATKQEQTEMVLAKILEKWENE